MSGETTMLDERPAGVPVQAVRVIVLDGSDQGARVVSTDPISIGTAASNDLVLADGTVSRFHLELERAGARIRVVDQGSTNGVLLDGARIERGEIRPGTTLQVGRTRVRVDDGDTVQVELHAADHLGELWGKSEVMRKLMARLHRAAASDASVLLLGETGSGKEVVARTLHAQSPRAGAPFEVVDCGSMQPTLIGSELFGHERGAFTGADDRHQGAFERADGGTIFLDELGELPAALQTALLGALERRTFRRLGGKTLIPYDARVICATHRDLRAEVNAGTFRQDLFYRVAVVRLLIPPLRERREDIRLLAEHFFRQVDGRGTLAEQFSEASLARLEAHAWPGNVRELRNTIEAAVVMGEEPELEPVAVAEPRAARAVRGLAGLAAEADTLFDPPFSEAKEQFERLYLLRQLADANGNVAEAARRIGLNRTYLFRLIKKYDLKLGA